MAYTLYIFSNIYTFVFTPVSTLPLHQHSYFPRYRCMAAV